MNNWIYVFDENNATRYVLGQVGLRPLIVFGVNPSTAVPQHLGNSDPTIKKVDRLSSELGFDSWIMLNLYPQIATDPNDLHVKIDESIHLRNLNEIKQIMKNFPNGILVAAWGNLITKRKYLNDVYNDILNIANEMGVKWYCFDHNKSGHPKHPLFVNEKNIILKKFNMQTYLY
jgi:hypothetical protein